MSQTVLLIADPNTARRKMLVQKCTGIDGLRVQGVATLGESRALCEAERPPRIAVAPELADLYEFAGFLRSAGAAGAEIVVYGQPRRRIMGVRYLETEPDSPGEDTAAVLLAGIAARVVRANAPGIVHPPMPAAAPAGEQLILIGASTGGVAALETVLAAFPEDCPPTLIVQHIREGFADSMVRRFDQMLRPNVLAAGDAVELRRGHVYLAARSDCHLGVSPFGTGIRSHLIAGDPVGGHCPAVDVLFGQGAAVAHRVSVRAALLTGMGADGAAGMSALRDAGAYTIAQDKESSIVWGMPRVAIERGAVADVLPLDRIGRALLEHRDAQAIA